MAPTRRQILRALAFGCVANPGCVAIDASGPRAQPPRAACVPADGPYWAARPAFPASAPAPTPGVPLPEGPK